MPPFLIDSEAGLMHGYRLYRLARDCGKTPYEMAYDRHLAFNATCQRAYDRVKQIRLSMAMQEMQSRGDDMGIGRVLAILQMMLED